MKTACVVEDDCVYDGGMYHYVFLGQLGWGTSDYIEMGEMGCPVYASIRIHGIGRHVRSTHRCR